MKTLLLACLLCCGFNTVIAQDTTPKALLAYIVPAWDKFNKQNFFIINPDGAVPEATAIYTLKSAVQFARELDENATITNKTARQMMLDINRDSLVYNHFPSESAALNFILANGWKLFTVITEIRTKADTEYLTGVGATAPYSNVFSGTKYLFTRTEK
jgi:hypothetical protein